MTLSYVTWLTQMWHDSLIRDIAHRYMRHDSLKFQHPRRPWHCPNETPRHLIPGHVWHDSLICDMTHRYMRHDSLIFQHPRRPRPCPNDESSTPLITGPMWHTSFVCDMTHSYVTWLTHMWHGSLIYDTIHSYATWLTDVKVSSTTSTPPQRLVYTPYNGSRVTWLTHMWLDSLICDMTHSYVTWLTHIWHDSTTCLHPRRGKGSVAPRNSDLVCIFIKAHWHGTAGRVFIRCVATHRTNSNRI